ncbi:MAG TPA: signal peptidase I [Armatimonadota bacterium]|nr:signal peptidase I [Armatimonadota bacterium]HOM70780.1 signal peptidase I [Armatimonadota bacterium]HOP80802.1 signal peptidase I [Armatimonadota bacterium]
MPVIEELEIVVKQDETAPDGIADPRQEKVTFALIVKTWVQTAFITVALLFFLVTFVVQGFAVSGSCMEPNLRTGERILGNKFVYRFVPPRRGDVIIFRYPNDPSKTYIKRVIGLPGETVEIRNGQVYINNRCLHESYVVYIPEPQDYGPKVISQHSLFVLGDYRDQSNDSRYWGELPMENLRAKAWLRYWPINRLDVMK